MFLDMFGRYARASECHGICAGRVAVDKLALLCIGAFYLDFSIGRRQAPVMNEIPSLQGLYANIYLLDRVTLDVYHEDP